MNRFARAFMIVTVLQSAATGWFFSTYVLFVLGNGLTLFHANMLNVGFMTVNFLFDPSTGRLADIFGRRKIYILGQFFWAAGMLVYWCGHGFWVFLAAEATSAVGSALMSGALDSWLRSNTDEEITLQALVKSATIGPLATIPTALLGGVVGENLGLEWPWFLAGVSSILSALLAIGLLGVLPEGSHGRKPGEEMPSVKEIALACLRSGPLRFSMVVALVSWAAFAPINMFWSPIMKEMSGATWWLGSLWIGIALATSAGAHLASIKSLQDGRRQIAVAIALTGLPLLFAPFVPGLAVLLVAFLTHEIGRGAINPILFTYSNRHIEDEVRSTANSVRSASRTLGGAIGLGLSGLLTLVVQPIAIWGMSAVALISLSLYAIWYRE